MTEQLKQLWDKIVQKRTELAGAKAGNYITDGNFRYSPSGEVIHIPSVKHLNKLTEMLAFLIGKERDHAVASEILGIGQAEFKWFGATVNQWSEDLKLRATQLQLNERAEKLKAMEDKFYAVADPEFVRALELEKLKDAVNSL